MEEIWKILDENNLYQISNLGRIKSFAFNSKYRYRTYPRISDGYIDYYGYKYFNIKIDKKYKILKLHRLVAKYFLDNLNSYKEINHKDGNKLNNNVLNLEWCSRSHNIKHAFRSGLKNAKGSKNANNILKEFEVKTIKNLFLEGISDREIHFIYKNKIGYGTIQAIKHKRIWKHIL
jgi:hypothetical protein